MTQEDACVRSVWARVQERVSRVAHLVDSKSQVSCRAIRCDAGEEV